MDFSSENGWVRYVLVYYYKISLSEFNKFYNMYEYE